MRTNGVGDQSISYSSSPQILAGGSAVGPKEGEGPLGKYFDVTKDDALMGLKSWEQAETQFLLEAMEAALSNDNSKIDDMDFLLAGDLLNQLIAANYAAEKASVPYFGLYGACSTFAEALILGAVLVDGGFADKVLAASSSHFDTAERQYRYPTEFGGQRPPTAQWTVTGAGAVIVGDPPSSGGSSGPSLTIGTIGKVIDMGVKDSTNMGGAMAPAAADTIQAHLEDTGRGADYYDLILTGDLGRSGSELLIKLSADNNIDLSKNHADCGLMIFDSEQDAHSGGSGAGCSAIVTASKVLQDMASGEYGKVLLVATGALFSPTSTQQGESIPCIAHAIALENSD